MQSAFSRLNCITVAWPGPILRDLRPARKPAKRRASSLHAFALKICAYANKRSYLPQRILVRVLGVRGLGISLVSSSNWAQLSLVSAVLDIITTQTTFWRVHDHYDDLCKFVKQNTCELNAPLMAGFRAVSGPLVSDQPWHEF
jgi:hypothetical protein